MISLGPVSSMAVQMYLEYQQQINKREHILVELTPDTWAFCISPPQYYSSRLKAGRIEAFQRC